MQSAKIPRWHTFFQSLDEEFDFEFWKRPENGKVEIDGYIPSGFCGNLALRSNIRADCLE